METLLFQGSRWVVTPSLMARLKSAGQLWQIHKHKGRKVRYWHVMVELRRLRLRSKKRLTQDPQPACFQDRGRRRRLRFGPRFSFARARHGQSRRPRVPRFEPSRSRPNPCRTGWRRKIFGSALMPSRLWFFFVRPFLTNVNRSTPNCRRRSNKSGPRYSFDSRRLQYNDARALCFLPLTWDSLPCTCAALRIKPGTIGKAILVSHASGQFESKKSRNQSDPTSVLYFVGIASFGESTALSPYTPPWLMASKRYRSKTRHSVLSLLKYKSLQSPSIFSARQCHASRGKMLELVEFSVVDLASSAPSKPTSFNRNCPGRSGERGKATLVQL